MPNMAYCRFSNTSLDLKDCYDNMNDEPLSDSENAARKKLIILCCKIALLYGHMAGMNLTDNNSDRDGDYS